MTQIYTDSNPATQGVILPDEVGSSDAGAMLKQKQRIDQHDERKMIPTTKEQIELCESALFSLQERYAHQGAAHNGDKRRASA